MNLAESVDRSSNEVFPKVNTTRLHLLLQLVTTAIDKLAEGGYEDKIHIK
ncbi:MAG TPA: hypothetical protein V6D28_02255 [Leptolyngbyaceae cyanobacterium]